MTDRITCPLCNWWHGTGLGRYAGIVELVKHLTSHRAVNLFQRDFLQVCPFCSKVLSREQFGVASTQAVSIGLSGQQFAGSVMPQQYAGSHLWIERLAAHLADTDYEAHIAAGLLGIGGPDD